MLTKNEQKPKLVKGSKMEFTTFPIYDEYPFQVEGVGYRSFVPKEGEDIAVGRDTGELYVVRKVPQSKRILHDGKSYTKFFTDAAIKLKDLSVPTSNLIYLIIARLSVNSLEVCITEEDYIDHCGYKKNSRRLYYQAVSELINLNVIKKKAGFRRCYWVNANMIFNGDRTKIKI